MVRCIIKSGKSRTSFQMTLPEATEAVQAEAKDRKVSSLLNRLFSGRRLRIRLDDGGEAVFRRLS